ncbi:MAG: hypothetical protein ACYC5N_10330 [Endomicrobiales bacterium]
MKRLRLLARISGVSGQSGIALVTVLMVLLFLLPVTMTFLSLATNHFQSATKEREINAARSIANNVVVDLMRQFSQTYYENRYDSDYITRGESFYRVGFSTVTLIADSNNHYLYAVALGKYGKDPAHPLFQKRLHAVVKFISPWTDFGTMINSNFTTSASGVDYSGKFWVNGNYSVTGDNVRFFGGPVFVSGNVAGNSSVVIDGDLYYGGGSAGNVTVLGSKYNFIPGLTFPTVNTSYYAAHYNRKITANSTVVFNGNGTFTIVGSETVAIQSGGFILYAENCNLTLRGTVSGRVTVVASGTGTKGCIIVNNNLVYANGANNASANDSLAVVASNKITFQKPAGNMTVCGVYQVASSNEFSLTGTNGGNFALIGTRNKPIIMSITCTTDITYDPNLNSFPPPGLPEKPHLVTWHMK